MRSINTSKIEEYIEERFNKEIPENLTYHSLIHTEYVASQAKLIGEKSGLSDEEMDMVITAAWFHDSGYIVSHIEHEEESKKIAQQYLSDHGIQQDMIDRILKCIDSTRMPQDPGDDLLSKILCDADMSYLSENFYTDRTMLLREEWNDVLDRDLSKRSYFKETIKMFENHSYFTEYGKKMMKPGKEENYKRLHAMLKTASKKAGKKTKDLNAVNKKLQDKLNREKLPGRGVESMFRLTARNQINLSAIADNKANLLISVNSIVLTVLLTVGVGRIGDNANFTLPAIVFIGTCLITIIFAILSTRPKISSGKFTKEDIHNHKVNLLFFGNFYDMEFEEYEWAVKEMMKDDNYLYSNMIRDQHSLGKVVSRKYKLLRIAYTIFMFGLILSTLLFVLILLIVPL